MTADELERPGFYYFRPKGANPNHIWVAQVSKTVASGLFATVFSDVDRDRISHRSVKDIGGQWFGPLPTPEMMKAAEMARVRRKTSETDCRDREPTNDRE